MNDGAYRENQGTGGERPEAGGHHQPAPSSYRDHDEDDFETFEQHRLERGYAGGPAEALLPPTRFVAERSGSVAQIASSSCHGIIPAARHQAFLSQPLTKRRSRIP